MGFFSLYFCIFYYFSLVLSHILQRLSRLPISLFFLCSCSLSSHHFSIPTLQIVYSSSSFSLFSTACFWCTHILILSFLSLSSSYPYISLFLSFLFVPPSLIFVNYMLLFVICFFFSVFISYVTLDFDLFVHILFHSSCIFILNFSPSLFFHYAVFLLFTLSLDILPNFLSSYSLSLFLHVFTIYFYHFNFNSLYFDFIISQFLPSFSFLYTFFSLNVPLFLHYCSNIPFIFKCLLCYVTVGPLSLPPIQFSFNAYFSTFSSFLPSGSTTLSMYPALLFLYHYISLTYGRSLRNLFPLFIFLYFLI